MLRAAWALLTRTQRAAFFQRPEITTLIETPEYQDIDTTRPGPQAGRNRGNTMARKRKTTAMNARDFVAGLRDAVSPGTAPDPETHRKPEPEPEPEPEQEQEPLGALFQQRTRF